MQSDTVKENTTPEQIRLLRANDEKTLQVFYQKNYAGVAKYILENNGTDDEAKDIYQEAFIAVWKNLQSGKFDNHADSSLDGYLYKVAKFKWIDHLRTMKRRPVIELDEESVSFVSVDDIAPEDEEKVKRIRKYFSQLGESCKDILSRYYFQRQTMKTIALHNGWTEPTAKNNKYRCLQRLREFLKNN